jgi:hypothetical protein
MGDDRWLPPDPRNPPLTDRETAWHDEPDPGDAFAQATPEEQRKIQGT